MEAVNANKVKRSSPGLLYLRVWGTVAGCLVESGVKKADIVVNLARWMGTPERIGGKGYRCSRRRKVCGPVSAGVPG